MIISRFSGPFGVALAGALLAGCGAEPASRPKVDLQSDSLAAILESDLRNPELAAAINEKMKALRAKGSPLTDELLAAGFRRAKAVPNCEALTYEGERRTRLGQDDTLRITWNECTGAKAAERKMVVTFGDT